MTFRSLFSIKRKLILSLNEALTQYLTIPNFLSSVHFSRPLVSTIIKASHPFLKRKSHLLKKHSKDRLVSLESLVGDGDNMMIDDVVTH